MSIVALLKAVEGRLRSAAVLNDPDGKVCGVQPDGRPPPFAGQWYYAVHWPGSRQDDRNPLADDRVHGVTVTVTARMAAAPRDRRGQRLTLDAELIDRAERLAAGGVVSASYEVLAAANALIPGTAEAVAAGGSGPETANGFVEPLVLLDYGPVQEQSPEWVGSDDAAAPTVLTCEVRFGGARRLQTL